MANLDKSIELADSLLASVPDEVFERILNEVKALGIAGPTYDEYLANFESEYDGQFDLNSGGDKNHFEFINDFEVAGHNTLVVRSTRKDAPVFTCESDFETGFFFDEPSFSLAA
ncbi:MAG: hypothetical protein IPG53_07650 [Ignavibacteriales bacterium]|jgi:hypothetical protein|nr:hypothetical protein [Ignavibacteriales bacterium]